MITPVHTQMLMSAVGHMTRMSRDKREVELGRMKLQALEMQLNSQRDLVATQAELFRELIHAMIEQRIDAVRYGFGETMSLFADQARHYMSQQETITNAQITSKDPIERAGFHARACEIDMQLRRIRTDAAKLYREMTRAILLIGGSMPSIAKATKSSLLLP
jgi:hypothetical protein